MNCPDCGKEVKIVALSGGECAVCDAAQAEIITESGHVFRGYMRHECKDGNERDAGGNSG